MIFSSFAISFYGGWQFDDGSFLAIFLLSSFLIVISKKGELFSQGELVLIATLFWLVLFSSPIFFPTFLILLVYHLCLQRINKTKIPLKQSLRNLVPLLIYVLIPILFFLTFLIGTSSLKDFYFNTIIYNNQTFIHRIHQSSSDIKILSFYSNAVFDTANHFVAVVKLRSPELLTFLKSAKFIIWPFNLDIAYSSYIKIIFAQLYDNFFIFETFIALFYFFGILSLLMRRKFSLALLCIIFTLFLRLRIQTKLHMAPFYLFSYFLLALTLSIYVDNILKTRKILLNITLLIMTIGLLVLFVAHNWYDFKQISFNRMSKQNKKTINYLRNNTTKNERILVFGDSSASYYYDSQRLPYSYFINYFPWYDWSDKLRNKWLQGLESYEGKYLVLDQQTWTNYCTNGEYQSWKKSSLDIIKSLYVIQKQLDSNLIFRKLQNGDVAIKCIAKID